MEAIESTIIKNLVSDDTYVRKVIPYIKPEYFNEYSDKILFDIINNFVVTYGQTPTKEVLSIEVDNRKDLNEDSYKQLQVKIDDIDNTEVDSQWLLDATEKWCKQRAVYLALLDSVKIADGQDEKRTEDAIPSILQELLAVSFDDHIGHDYIEDYEDRFAFYHRNESKIPFDLSLFNKITKGGIPNKTLNVALAGTGVGKSLFMCHMAAASLLQGKNVLYITLEMAEEKIAERIDANLLNVNIKDIEDLPEQLFESKVTRLAQKTNGKLIIKEYPTASAHSGHFKALLNDLSLKKSFKPDIIFIDYLNICASSRYKGALVNSYTYVKASLRKNLEVLLLSLISLLLAPLRLLALVMALAMLILLIPLSLLDFLLLRTSCLLLSLQKNLKISTKSWSSNSRTAITTSTYSRDS